MLGMRRKPVNSASPSSRVRSRISSGVGIDSVVPVPGIMTVTLWGLRVLPHVALGGLPVLPHVALGGLPVLPHVTLWGLPVLPHVTLWGLRVLPHVADIIVGAA